MIIKPEELKIVYEKEDDGRIRPVYFIDAVEVVRCKDCKHNSLKRMSGNTYCDLGMGLFQLYDFCSLGERKSEEDPSHPCADSVMMGE